MDGIKFEILKSARIVCGHELVGVYTSKFITRESNTSYSFHPVDLPDLIKCECSQSSSPPEYPALNCVHAQVGVDFSKQMLSKLREKIEKSKLKGIEVVEGDAETIQLPAESFDWILCSSAFIWMSDLAGTLSRWKSFLVKGGGIAFHAFPEEAFVTG